MNPPERRKSVRGVIISPDGLVLLMSARASVKGGLLWMPPGGGVEAGEDNETGLRRELFEETGLQGATVGPFIWKRHHDFEWDGRTFSQDEAFYLIQTPVFVPNAGNNPCASEAATFLSFRWWTVPDILSSTELFVPRRLGAFLQDLLEKGPPPAPIDVGV